jgi:LPS export ABC transporter protein LptC
MASWQNRARLGVAIFGLVFAAIVYFATGERRVPPPPEPVKRLDPKAIVETANAVLQQMRGGEEDFEVHFREARAYADGSTRYSDVRITIPNRGGRSYGITAREAWAGKDSIELRLARDVRLTASDGFELATEEATFDRKTGHARAAGAVTFRKGRLAGSGVGMTYTYNDTTDVLRFDDQSKVTTTDERGDVVFDFAAGATTLDRLENFLTLDRSVRVMRDNEVIESDRATARLSENEEVVTYLELRGRSRVTGGGGPFESMAARDIDLDYTDDGERLERVVLSGTATIAMAGRSGAAGRRLEGDQLDLQLASDGALTQVAGMGGVRLELPAGQDAPMRSIRAATLDATGEAGRGLTRATFTDEACGTGAARDRCVEYREEAGTGKVPRLVRSRHLVASLADDAVTSAIFTGLVTFTEQGLEAAGADVRYDPAKGSLRLTGRDAVGGPRVEDDQVTVAAETVDVRLDGHQMTAAGGVKTTLRPRPSRAGGERTGTSRLPGLLRQQEAVAINADALDYQGSDGRATYTGHGLLVQGETTIRGDAIVIDRGTGDLVVTGAASSDLVLETGISRGRAHQIRYEDARRTITYSLAKAQPTTAKGLKGATVSLNAPEGNVSGEHIEIRLAKDAGRLEQLDALRNVTVEVGTRTATGAGLTYYATDARYEMVGLPGAPVVIIDRAGGACRETTGQPLTFYKATDTITVGGTAGTLTQMKSGQACGPSPSSR